MNILNLDGCAPAPLAHYLKALGILRLVTEQPDKSARGWWEGDRFRLATVMSREELENFFLKTYKPTPLLAPWNGGTGFYPKDKKAAKAIAGIRKHPSTRFDDYRQALLDAQIEVGMRKEAPEKRDKEQFISNCFLKWRGKQQDAMAAAIVLSQTGKPAYPALLGTGFNDGRLDFTSNFMERLLFLFPSSENTNSPVSTLLQETLWRTPSMGMDSKGAIGQYLPGNAGGANCMGGTSGDPFSNPWDFVFMLEGTVLFTAHATKRFSAVEQSRAASPFSITSQGAGYVSASESDESTRGEQWMPLWRQPITLDEFRRLLAEGRAQIGRKTVREPLDLARAVARHGIARGITEFQRYGYIERNGQANLAVPLGRFKVPEQDSPKLSCLDDLDQWLQALSRQARDDNAPARIRHAERRLSDALFAVTQHPEEQSRWQAVFAGLADLEAVLKTCSGRKAGFIPRLRPQWVQAADDGTPEFRLALSCALQDKPIRRHWLPLNKDTTDLVMQGRDGANDAIALVSRRLVEASRQGSRHLPLTPGFRAFARPDDLAALVAGSVDINRTMALARVLMAIDRERWANQPQPPVPSKGGRYPDDAWLAIRLAMLPWKLQDGREIFVDPAILRRLSSGDAATAVDLALRRLRSAGIRASVRVATVAPDTARLWAAALAFPITRTIAADFVRRLDPDTNTKEEHRHAD